MPRGVTRVRLAGHLVSDGGVILRSRADDTSVAPTGAVIDAEGCTMAMPGDATTIALEGGGKLVPVEAPKAPTPRSA